MAEGQFDTRVVMQAAAPPKKTVGIAVFRL
jgi:hypothetical protein